MGQTGHSVMSSTEFDSVTVNKKIGSMGFDGSELPGDTARVASFKVD